jgi:hypothetical protein
MCIRSSHDEAVVNECDLRIQTAVNDETHPFTNQEGLLKSAFMIGMGTGARPRVLTGIGILVGLYLLVLASHFATPEKIHV